jgi:hypothetical protein
MIRLLDSGLLPQLWHMYSLTYNAWSKAPRSDQRTDWDTHPWGSLLSAKGHYGRVSSPLYFLWRDDIQREHYGQFYMPVAMDLIFLLLRFDMFRLGYLQYFIYFHIVRLTVSTC